MQHANFQIGTVFMARHGLWCRCTDIGQRTIVAIVVSHDPPFDPILLQGPPYLTGEIVLDERDIADCRQTAEEAIHTTLKGVRSGQVGYRHIDGVFDDLEARAERLAAHSVDDEHMEIIRAAELEARRDPSRRYPFPRVLSIDRIAPDGDTLHPYVADRTGDGGWMIRVYRVHAKTFDSIPVSEFIRLPIVDRISE